jgi:CRISPR-associated protein Csb2
MIIQVHLLNGFHGTIDGKTLEYPPAPGRLYKALVSGMSNRHRNEENEEDHQRARAALLYLEKLPLPNIYFKMVDLKKIKTPTVMVPMLDLDTEDFDERGQRRAEKFPRCYPQIPYVYYEWANEGPNEHWESIALILPYPFYFGNPKSIATFTLHEHLPYEAKRLDIAKPDEEGNLVLSKYYDGILDELDKRHNNAAIAGSHSTARYSIVKKSSDTCPAVSLYEKFNIYKLVGDFKPLINQSALITDNLRSMVLRICGGMGIDPPTLIGKDKTTDHAAYFPLCNVGFDYSNGNILGLGIALPKCSDFKECESVLSKIPSHDLYWGEFHWKLEPIPNEDTSYTLKSKTWKGPSRRWTTVTPIEVHNIYRKQDKRTAWQFKMSQEIQGIGERWAELRGRLLDGTASHFDEYIAYILNNCKQLKLPLVEDIVVDFAPYLNGSLHVKSFVTRNQLRSQTSGHLIHCTIIFSTKVEGPLSIGRGRNFGIGVMKPF